MSHFCDDQGPSAHHPTSSPSTVPSHSWINYWVHFLHSTLPPKFAATFAAPGDLPKYLTNNPNRFAYNKSVQFGRILDTRAMSAYIQKCQEAGVGPTGILTKIDQLIRVLAFWRVISSYRTCSVPILNFLWNKGYVFFIKNFGASNVRRAALAMPMTGVPVTWLQPFLFYFCASIDVIIIVQPATQGRGNAGEKGSASALPITAWAQGAEVCHRPPASWGDSSTRPYMYSLLPSQKSITRTTNIRTAKQIQEEFR